MRFNWALDRKSRARFVKNFNLDEAEGKRMGELVVYDGALLASTYPVTPGSYGEEKRKILKAQMERQVIDAKAKKYIYEGKVKRSKHWTIALGILSALGILTVVSSQFIDQIAAFLLPLIEEITYALYALAAVSLVSFGKAIRNGLVLDEIEKDILVLDKSVELNKAKEDEFNLRGLSFKSKTTIINLNDDKEEIDVVSADQLETRDLYMLLQNYELGQKALATGQYDRETLGGKVYELKPKTPKTPRAPKNNK